MSDVCRELGWGIRLMGWGLRSGELSVWHGFDDFEMTLRRAGHVPAAGLWPRTLIIIYKVRGSGGVKFNSH